MDQLGTRDHSGYGLGQWQTGWAHTQNGPWELNIWVHVEQNKAQQDRGPISCEHLYYAFSKLFLPLEGVVGAEGAQQLRVTDGPIH